MAININLFARFNGSNQAINRRLSECSPEELSHLKKTDIQAVNVFSNSRSRNAEEEAFAEATKWAEKFGKPISEGISRSDGNKYYSVSNAKSVLSPAEREARFEALTF